MSGFTVPVDEIVLEPAETVTTPAIRKSCHFCRTRKIRCTGQRVCAACRSRNLDCIYRHEALKGRPRNSSSGHAAKASSKGSENKSKSRDSSNDGHFNHDNPAPTSVPLRPSFNPPTPSSAVDTPNTEERTLGLHLEEIFRRKFLHNASQQIATAGQPLAELGKPSPSTSEDGSAQRTHSFSAAVTYNKLFLSVTQGLVESISARFGSLGCCQAEDSVADFISTSLAQDNTETMYDVERHSETLPEYNDHQVRQMIELWFIHHPLSFIVSKTLLLHKYRSSSHDPCLLAAILADASYALKDGGVQSGQRLFQWAVMQLSHRKAGKPSLSTIQVMILLGWHMLCFADTRRGFCYLELASSAIVEMQMCVSDTTFTDLDLINGVNVGKVELELKQRVYWLAFAVELWAAIQMDVALGHVMPLSVSADFPTLTLESSSSAAFTLDIQSGNVATLRVQERVIRHLWPLSHIASTVAHIYALYPRDSAEAPSIAGGWESQTLSKLHHLQKGPRNLYNLCQNVRDILCDGLGSLQAQMYNHPSQIFVLCAYRILIVQLLFPKGESDAATVRMTESVLDDAIGSIRSLKEVLCLADRSSLVDIVPMDTSELGLAAILMLGLDTCSRALGYIYRIYTSSSMGEKESILSRRDELANMSRCLHHVSKHPKLQAVLTTSSVKKSLKEVKRGFESLDPPPQLPQPQLGHWSDGIASEALPPCDDVQQPLTFADPSFETLVRLDTDFPAQWTGGDFGRVFGGSAIGGYALDFSM